MQFFVDSIRNRMYSVFATKYCTSLCHVGLKHIKRPAAGDHSESVEKLSGSFPRP